MKKLISQVLAEDAPKEWQPTPPGFLVVLRRLERRGRVEISQAPGGWAWRRRPRRRRQERKAS